MSSVLPTPDVSPRPGLPPSSPLHPSPSVGSKTRPIRARSSASQPCRPRNRGPEDNSLIPATQPRLGTIASSISNALRRAKSSGKILASNITDGPPSRLGNPLVVFPIARPDSSPTRTPKKTIGLVVQSRSTHKSVPRTKNVSLPISASTLVPMPDLVTPSRPHGTYTICEGCHGTGWNRASAGCQSPPPPYPTPNPYSTPAPPYTAPVPLPSYSTQGSYMTPGPSTTPRQLATPAPFRFATSTKTRKRYTGAKSSSGLRLASIGVSGFGPDQRVNRSTSKRARVKGKKIGALLRIW